MKEKVVQIIVSSEKSREELIKLKEIGKIKYELPMIHSWVMEIEKDKLSKIEEFGNDFCVELDTDITARMNRARDLIHVQWAHSRKIYGKDIGVAVVDTGIYSHMDFTESKNRISAFCDFVNHKKQMYDDCGHGTHVAGIIGGSGAASGGKYMGVAPECNIISVKVLNQKGNGNVSDVLAGLQWIVENKEKYNIRIVNISVGTTKNKGNEDSHLIKGVDAVWDSGIVVVVAAGNNGPRPMSIGAPGISRKVITVGAMDDNIPIELPGGMTKDYSGRGPTLSCIKKPDIVAPGSNIISCNGVIKGNYMGRRPYLPYIAKSGTSMATPIVSGAIALLLSVYPDMTPKDVKMRLKDSAIDLGYSWRRQGWGMLDVQRLIEKV